MSTAIASDAWLAARRPNAHARSRLFCFPFAGAGASLFREWPQFLPADVDVCPVQPPGRENRLREASFTRMGPLVSAATAALQPWLDRPYALFGHSLGALVAFEVARKVMTLNLPAPGLLVVSGCEAPQSRQPPTRFIHRLPDAEFRDELRRMGGTSPQVLDNAELMQIFEPILRADFAVLETYTYRPSPGLHCPILAIGGLNDTVAPLDGHPGWRAETTGAFRLRALPGDHFFVQSAPACLTDVLSEEFRQTELTA